MVKKISELNIGDRIELIRINSKGKKNYISQILDIMDEEVFIVSGPIYKSEIVLIHKDEIVKVSYIIDNKGRYSFNARVLRREYERVYKLELQKISNTKRFQLRGFYRFAIDIPAIKQFPIKRGNKKEIVTEKCRTKDVSGGGLMLYSNYKHEIGDIVLCKFNIDDHQINAKGKIVRIENIDTFDYDYGLGIRFIDISENDRDRIIQFIFLKQRLLREKGLI
ncbi:putative Type IV pilus assembly PilZ [[Clostridium] ultunense Esp]|uniref:Putative Type IV pilus assembly PilZ n=1 Tax=[Clostridium] ultunense Esp TaxID=1288971 RepID=M1ZGV0_9FIRM|nr:PilZ domain-containing protein [Schnuerera ultunensis]CCQ93032.1 putative Type IV pilus assembly PilZ [[Clostridium] ultunense Esp]SHD77035.1 putative Type IV pilus assembly PilZ [[Clostridium] ultunense Esp]